MYAVPSNIESMDKQLLAAFHTITNPGLDWTAWILSTAGWLGLCFWILVIVLWRGRGLRPAAFEIALAMVIGGIVAEILKHSLHRLRPDVLYPQYVHLPIANLWDSHYSFPSGHAVLAAAAGVAALLALKNRYCWLLVVLALAIGWARIYQGVHWPSDVLIGLVIGTVSAVVSHLAMRKLAALPVLSDHRESSANPRGTWL